MQVPLEEMETTTGLVSVAKAPRAATAQAPMLVRRTAIHPCIQHTALALQQSGHDIA